MAVYFCVIKCTRGEEFSGYLLCWWKASVRNYLSLINVKGESRSCARNVRVVVDRVTPAKERSRPVSELNDVSQQTRCSRLAVERNLIRRAIVSFTARGKSL